LPITNIYLASRVFTGEAWLTDHAIIAQDGKIKEVLPVSSLSPGEEVKRFDDSFIAPAFIDLQIYGAHGKLLAVYPEADSLFRLKEYCNKGGAAWFQPTVATNTYDVFYKCIDAVRDYWSKGGDGVPGLHIEGPWINKIKRGAHVESLIHTPTLQQAKELLDYGKGVIKMITLAPEICSKEIIDMVHSYGVFISAGHSNATYKEAMIGFAAGIDTVTHLYNAMSPLQHREPGLVGATFDHDKIPASIIPDGFHVDYAAIRIAKQVMKERLFVITDAVTETDKGYYPHKRVGDKYESEGVLSGSALTMNKAVKNLVNYCGIELGEAMRMCSLYPARAINMGNQLGKIKKGYKKSMVVMNDQLEVKELILANGEL
jgi:N-acetylglucosamine-6-phosphate deacetylase